MILIKKKINIHGKIAAYSKLRLTTFRAAKQKKASFPKGIMWRAPEESRAPAEVLLMTEVPSLLCTRKSPNSNWNERYSGKPLPEPILPLGCVLKPTTGYCQGPRCILMISMIPALEWLIP